MDFNKAKLPAQRKSTGRRSRNGCITCKIRHVKCGEERPECLQCQLSGRRCDGYDNNASQSQLRQRIADNHASGRRTPTNVSPDRRIVLLPETREERQYVDFFLSTTTNALSGFFPCALWSYYIPQISESEPTIRHAMIAIGAMHSQYGVPMADRLETDRFVLEQYNTAIRHLMDVQSNGGGQSVDLTLATCSLFICLEILRGNNTQALDHIEGGLKLIDRGGQGEAVSPGGEFTRQLRQLFVRLNWQASLYGRKLPLFLTTRTNPFSPGLMDISSARDCLDGLLNRAIALVRSVADQNVGEDAAAPDSRKQEQKSLKTELDAWLVSFDQTAQRMGAASMGQSDLRATLLLRTYHRIALIWVQTAPDQERIFDQYISDFTAIVEYTEQILSLTAAIEGQAPTQQPPFSLEPEILPPLLYVSQKCRNPHIRRRAIHILSHYSRKEGMWTPRRTAGIARLLMEVEELACPHPVRKEADIDETARVHDFTQPEEADINPCQVVLIYRPSEGDGQGRSRRESVFW